MTEADAVKETRKNFAWRIGFSLANVWVILLLGIIHWSLATAVGIPMKNGTFYIFATVLVATSASTVAVDSRVLPKEALRDPGRLILAGWAIGGTALVIFAIINWERLSGRGAEPAYEESLVQLFGLLLAVLASIYGYECEKLRREVRTAEAKGLGDNAVESET